MSACGLAAFDLSIAVLLVAIVCGACALAAQIVPVPDRPGEHPDV